MNANSKAGRTERGSPQIGALLVGALTAYSIAAKRRGHRNTANTRRGEADNAHGRQAAWPSHIPKRGWWDILVRLKDDISQRNLSLVAAGVAFYALLAIPAALTALVSLYGLVFDPNDVQRQIGLMQGVLPAEVIKILADQLQTLTSHPSSTLGVGLIMSLMLALWSARSATSAMMAALNITYAEPEKRNFLWFQIIAFGLTFGTVLFAIIALTLIAVLPAIIDLLPLGAFGKLAASVVRWPILAVMVMGMLAAIYRFAPSREEPRWRWVSSGAFVATILWILGSALFSLYVSKFAAYDKSYGSLGAVVVLLMWLYLSAFVVLLGAELNAEIEHQTARDSTTGESLPMGQRGANMADTLGDAR